MTTPQTDQFVPLIAAAPAGAKREFQITVIPQAQQTQAFQSFGNGTAAGSVPAFGKNCEPQLSVQRDNGRVTNIRIQCNCGQTIDLACVYDEKPARVEAPKKPEPPKVEKPPAPVEEKAPEPPPKRNETSKRRK